MNKFIPGQLIEIDFRKYWVDRSADEAYEFFLKTGYIGMLDKRVALVVGADYQECECCVHVLLDGKKIILDCDKNAHALKAL